MKRLCNAICMVPQLLSRAQGGSYMIFSELYLSRENQRRSSFKLIRKLGIFLLDVASESALGPHAWQGADSDRGQRAELVSTDVEV